eukprot:1675882-Pleurochrysis_carterae.AAC.1
MGLGAIAGNADGRGLRRDWRRSRLGRWRCVSFVLWERERPSLRGRESGRARARERRRRRRRLLHAADLAVEKSRSERERGLEQRRLRCLRGSVCVGVSACRVDGWMGGVCGQAAMAQRVGVHERARGRT